MIKRILLLLMLVGLASGQCDEGYTEYDGECYYDNDLSFLTLIIYLNDIEFELFYDIGLTIWQNGHINTLLLEGLAIHEVPTNIQNLDSLITLSFSDNELEYLPAAIGNLPSLNTLFLSNNLLIEIPEEIGNLSNLEFLHLPGNQLVSLPSTISNLSSLISLNIDNNLVTTFPSGIMELNSLRYFYMANNTMQELPSDIGTLSALQILSAYSNTIVQIPSSIGELSNLYHLDFMNNELTDIPETICNIYDNLTVFSIGLNYICPPYPDCVEDNMGEQDTSNCEPCNEGEVELWDECYSIENTTQLDLGNNQLTGSIPPEIGNLTNLTWLYLSNNQLTGPIPPESGNLNNLIYLDLGSNQLTGSIPLEIGNLTNLEWLYLSNNQLTEEIPLEIGNLNNLIYLDLFNNQLTGEIPENICDLNINWSSSSYFSISNNQLCPPYPSCIEDYVGYQDTTNCDQISIMDETFPFTYKLHSAYPNPFNPVTTLRYELPEDALVNITIYDMMGRVVKTLINDQQTAGYRSLQWNAANDAGSPVSAGLYLYTIEAGEFRQAKKMILLK